MLGGLTGLTLVLFFGFLGLVLGSPRQRWQEPSAELLGIPTSFVFAGTVIVALALVSAFYVVAANRSERSRADQPSRGGPW